MAWNPFPPTVMLHTQSTDHLTHMGNCFSSPFTEILQEMFRSTLQSFRMAMPRCRQPHQLLSHSERTCSAPVCQNLCSRGLQISRHRLMLQIHPGTSYHACKYEKHSSSEQGQILTALVLCERQSQVPNYTVLPDLNYMTFNYTVLPDLTNYPKSSSYSQKLAQVKRSNTIHVWKSLTTDK